MADGEGGQTAREIELQRQLDMIQALTHIGSWHWTIATGAVTWSDELYRIYGLEPGSVQITLEYFLSRIHPDERERLEREIQQALQQPGRFAYRELIVRPDGSRRTLDTVGESVADAHGRVVHLAGTCRDITDVTVRDERLQFYADVFHNLRLGLSVWQCEHGELRMIAFNPAAEHLAGVALGGLLGQTVERIVPGPAGEMLADKARGIRNGEVRAIAPFRVRDAPGAATLAGMAFALPGRHLGFAIEDVTAQVCAQTVQAAERRALEMLAEGQPLEAILATLVRAIEEVSSGAIASILLLDDDGRTIRHGSAPGLPDDYNQAIAGQPIGPRAGSCGTAMFRKELVAVTDVETDPLWSDYVGLIRPLGLRACWSMPILANDGRVLGTFALYHRTPRAPDPATIDVMRRAAHVTSIVLQRRALDDLLRALAGRIEAAREEERTTIARDIHDQLGQAITALKLDVGWLRRRVEDPALDAKLEDMSRATEDLLQMVRRISADLRPGLLDDVGLRAAIEWQAEEFQRKTGTTCVFRADVSDLQLERSLATAVFRIFQEALTNVARHAEASQVDVVLALERGELKLEVSDDGVGIPDVGPRTTLGVLGMVERARRAGGECTVKRRSPRGTTVCVHVPLRFPAERGA